MYLDKLSKYYVFSQLFLYTLIKLYRSDFVMDKKLTRSRNNRALQGVCGGIAEYFGISSFGIRLIFLFLPANLIIYIILANIMPESPVSL